MKDLFVLDLGLIGYSEALEVQRRAAMLRISGALPCDLLILCEHPPVVTLGRARKAAGHLLMAPEALRELGAEVHETERGGDVTFHGPGQLVGYTVIDLKEHRQDLHWFLRQLEQVVIDAIERFGVVGGRVPDFTGVWVGNRKIASIGVHARDWVTWHGFALNVTTDLSWFDTIVPCGIVGVTMTSLEEELMNSADVASETANDDESDVRTIDASSLGQFVREATIAACADVFELRATLLPDDLRHELLSGAK